MREPIVLERQGLVRQPRHGAGVVPEEDALFVLVAAKADDLTDDSSAFPLRRLRVRFIPRGVFIAGASATDPRVYVGEQEFPEPADPMGGQRSSFYPAIDGVSGDSEVLGHRVDGYPRL